MKVCLFAGARASRRRAVGDAPAIILKNGREDFAAAGKAVMVCDVEVIEDVVLRVLAIAADFYQLCRPAVFEGRNFGDKA